MAMNGERELNRGHPVPASSTKRKEEDAGCVLGVGNQQKWDTFVKERSGGNGSALGLP
jgi:hypothetical protein